MILTLTEYVSTIKQSEERTENPMKEEQRRESEQGQWNAAAISGEERRRTVVKSAEDRERENVCGLDREGGDRKSVV